MTLHPYLSQDTELIPMNPFILTSNAHGKLRIWAEQWSCPATWHSKWRSDSEARFAPFYTCAIHSDTILEFYLVIFPIIEPQGPAAFVEGWLNGLDRTPCCLSEHSTHHTTQHTPSQHTEFGCQALCLETVAKLWERKKEKNKPVHYDQSNFYLQSEWHTNLK